MKNLQKKCSTIQARAHLYRLYIVAKSLKEEHPEIFAKVIQSIAFALYSSGQKRDAKMIFDEAEEAVKLCLPEIKDLIFYRQLQYKLKIDRTNAKEAERLITLMESNENIARGWWEVGMAQKKEGNTSWATIAFEKSLEFTKQVEDQEKRLHLQMELSYILCTLSMMWLYKPLLNEIKKEIKTLEETDLAVLGLMDTIMNIVQIKHIGYHEMEEQLNDAERLLQEHEMSDVKRTEYQIEIMVNSIKKSILGIEEYDKVIDEIQNQIDNGLFSSRELCRVLRSVAIASFKLGYICAGNILKEAITTSYEIKDEMASSQELYLCVKLASKIKEGVYAEQINEVLLHLDNKLFEKSKTAIDMKKVLGKYGSTWKTLPFTYNIQFDDYFNPYVKGGPQRSRIILTMANIVSSPEKKLDYLKRALKTSSMGFGPISTVQIRCEIAKVLWGLGELEYCWSVLDGCLEIVRTSDVIDELNFMIAEIAGTIWKIMNTPPKRQKSRERKFRKKLSYNRWFLPLNEYQKILFQQRHSDVTEDVMYV